METVETISSRDYKSVRPKIALATSQGSAAIPNWLDTVRAHCFRLVDLNEGWDSYGAKAINPTTAADAVGFLMGVVPGDLPDVPNVVPTVGGGIQFEWHKGSRSLELAFAGPARVSMFFLDHETGEEREQELIGNLTPLREAFKKLTERP